jgi:hypothetical protein
MSADTWTVIFAGATAAFTGAIAITGAWALLYECIDPSLRFRMTASRPTLPQRARKNGAPLVVCNLDFRSECVARPPRRGDRCWHSRLRSHVWLQGGAPAWSALLAECIDPSLRSRMTTASCQGALLAGVRLDRRRSKRGGRSCMPCHEYCD